MMLRIYFITVVAVFLGFLAIDPVALESQMRQSPPERSPKYLSRAGEKIGFALVKECASSIGTITEVDLSDISISLKTDLLENKSALHGKRTFEILNASYRPIKAPSSASPVSQSRFDWFPYVQLRKGAEIIIFHCEGKGPRGVYRFATTDSELFPEIERVIDEYKKAIEDQDSILDWKEKIAGSKNEQLYASALTELLVWHKADIADLQNLVIVQLLNSGGIPPDSTGKAMSSLGSYLSSQAAFTRSDLRAMTFNLTIQLAGDDEKKYSDLALMALVSASEYNRAELIKYFEPKVASRIHSNTLKFDERRQDKGRINKFRIFLEGVIAGMPKPAVD